MKNLNTYLKFNSQTSAVMTKPIHILIKKISQKSFYNTFPDMF